MSSSDAEPPVVALGAGWAGRVATAADAFCVSNETCIGDKPEPPAAYERDYEIRRIQQRGDFLGERRMIIRIQQQSVSLSVSKDINLTD